MVLKEDQVLALIKDNEKPPDWIEQARKDYKTLNALINGENYLDELSQIENIEKSENRWEVRKKYSRSITDIVSRLLRPIDNIYSATGGSKNYLLSDDQKKILLETLSKVRGNQSLESWLKNNWINLYHSDPNGIIFLEYKEDEKCWPTYKSITSIRNYKKNGQNLEWLLFEPEEVKEKDQVIEKIRFVDDEKDYTYKKNGSDYSLIEKESFKHPFHKVPGIVNSNIQKIGSDLNLSPLQNIVGILKEYLRDQSIKTIYKFLLWVPIFWRYKMECDGCRGTGKKDGDNCSLCDGNGFKVDRDATDEVILPIPDGSENVKLAPDIAGWINPPPEILEEFNKELNLLGKNMHEALWGAYKQHLTSGSKTIIEIWTNEQPVINKLNNYGDVAEWMEQELTELIANFLMPTKSKENRISVINYGRNYIIQPPEFLLEEYQKSKKAGDGIVILERKLNEYLTSKYKNDPQSLRIQLIQKRLEPYVHYTIDEVNKIFGQIETKKKMLFVDWLETIEYKDYTKSIEVLEKQMNDYINKIINEKTESHGKNNSSNPLPSDEGWR